MEIRIPYVPDYNDKEIHKIIEFVKNLKNVTKIEILPYHNYAGNKYQSLGLENTLPPRMPTEEEVEKIKKQHNTNKIK